MAPFVPLFISEQLNLVVALLVGIAFGFVLEQAGFSSSRRLAGVFYGYDFTVLRVFFTAAVTAMSGVLLLGSLGLLDTDLIYVNPLWLGPALLGGVVMGLGFILGGYCPGTSVCAAAIGKVDAMFFILGGLLGVFLFGEFFPLFATFYDATALGPLRVFRSLGLPQGVFAFLLIAMAVGAFIVTSRIERKVAPHSAPSLSFPFFKHVAAGTAVLLLACVLLFVPDYKTRMLRKVTDPAYVEAHKVQEMEPDELGFRLVDRDPLLKIVDLRPSASATPLPGALNLTLQDLFNREHWPALASRRLKKVVVADDDAAARKACLLLAELGFENLAVLKGGYPAFEDRILNPSVLPGEGGRWHEEVRRFREGASIEIRKQVDEQKAKANRAPKQEKKIQGGC